MKKVLFLSVLFTIVFSVVAYAQDKVGVVSLQYVMVNSDYGKAMADKLKAKFEPMQKDLEKDAADIQKLEAELKNQDIALKLEAKQDKQREFRRKVRDHQDSLAAFRQKFQTESQKQQQPILQRIQKVVNEYGKANKFALILESSSGVIYAGDGIDITEAITGELNKLKKAGK